MRSVGESQHLPAFMTAVNGPLGGLIENEMGNAAFLSQPSDIISSAKLYGNIHTNAHLLEGLPQLLLDLIHVGSGQEAEKNIAVFQVRLSATCSYVLQGTALI